MGGEVSADQSVTDPKEAAAKAIDPHREVIGRLPNDPTDENPEAFGAVLIASKVSVAGESLAYLDHSSCPVP